jgi:hypothetical protein
MEDHIELIKLDPNIDESILDSYYHAENQLFIKIKTKKFHIYEFMFTNPILFIHSGENVSKFCLNKSQTPFFVSALTRFYEYPYYYDIPKDQPFKLFQFVDSVNETSLEIAAESFEYKLCNS